MEKVPGVPLRQVWDSLELSQKLQILLALTHLQKEWLNVSFSHYGSLYYANDLTNAPITFYKKNNVEVSNSPFAIGPVVGRNWVDAGRASLNVDKGPCTLFKRFVYNC